MYSRPEISHPKIHTARGLVDLLDLQPGDLLLQPDGSTASIDRMDDYGDSSCLLLTLEIDGRRKSSPHVAQRSKVLVSADTTLFLAVSASVGRGKDNDVEVRMTAREALSNFTMSPTGVFLPADDRAAAFGLKLDAEGYVRLRDIRPTARRGWRWPIANNAFVIIETGLLLPAVGSGASLSNAVPAGHILHKTVTDRHEPKRPEPAPEPVVEREPMTEMEAQVLALRAASAIPISLEECAKRLGMPVSSIAVIEDSALAKHNRQAALLDQPELMKPDLRKSAGRQRGRPGHRKRRHETPLILDKADKIAAAQQRAARLERIRGEAGP